MNESKLHAWILLSIPETRGSLQGILVTADIINHAIPTDQELRVALGWLRANGLARTVDGRYATTEAGARLLDRLRTPGSTSFETWESLTRELERLDGAVDTPEDISPEELKLAYLGYRKAFRALLGSMERAPDA